MRLTTKGEICGRNHADLDFAHGEDGVGGRDGDVGDTGEAEAAAHGEAFDRGDHRLRRRVHRLHHGAEAPVVFLDLVGRAAGGGAARDGRRSS